MVSRAKKSVIIYTILLLSSPLRGYAQLAGQTAQTFTNNAQFGNTFANTQGFSNAQFGNQLANTQGFGLSNTQGLGMPNTQGFGMPNTQGFGNAGFLPNTYSQQAVLPHSSGFHAAKGYGSPLYGGNMYYNYAHPVNAQYWTGHSLAAGYHQYPQAYGGYGQYGQPYYSGYGGYQSWNYPQQYGNMGVHPAYSGQYMHYPNFNANYWTGHHNMYPVYPMYPVHGMQRYPHPVPYGQYPYHPGYYYGRPRGFLGGLGQSKMVKGLLGALLVGAVAGKIARGK